MVKTTNSIKEIIQDLSHLVYPYLCIGCGGALDSEEADVCQTCWDKLPLTRYWQIAENPVARMFWGKIQFRRAASYLHFNKGEKVQSILHALKYKQALSLGMRLGEGFGKQIHDAGWSDIDVVVPVPLHPAKLKQRGFNQCDPIAQAMAHELNARFAPQGLIRKEDNASQTKLGRYDRWMNVSDLFEVVDPREVEGKHVLIVDDVITTGATIEASAHAVSKIPKTRISLATIACPPLA